MGKDKTKKKKLRHDPLEKQLHNDKFLDENKKSKKQPKKALQQKNKKEDDQYIASSLSKKILKAAREQQQELDNENEYDMEEGYNEMEDVGEKPNRQQRGDDDDVLKNMPMEDLSDDDEAEQIDDEVYYDEKEIEALDPEDEKVLNAFMNPKGYQSRSLSDIIMQKIKEKEQIAKEQGVPAGDMMSETGSQIINKKLHPKVIKVYKGVGTILKKYTSGKLPKAFKILPSLSNWEEILYLTNPDEWSAPAVFQGTRLFASNLNARMAQRFYSLVLLPRVRDDINTNKKLNFHLYQALKKACFKPAGFYKGIVLPLCESGNCTLREAHIISSIIAKMSLPVLHSSAALLKLATMKYSGTNSIFIKVLINKKYALPYRVIDALVEHFVKFADLPNGQQMPVIWHQSLLIFAQRYKTDLTQTQKKMLLYLCRSQNHCAITPEVRRELENSPCRGETPTTAAAAAAATTPSSEFKLPMAPPSKPALVSAAATSTATATTTTTTAAKPKKIVRMDLD